VLNFSLPFEETRHAYTRVAVCGHAAKVGRAAMLTRDGYMRVHLASIRAGVSEERITCIAGVTVAASMYTMVQFCRLSVVAVRSYVIKLGLGTLYFRSIRKLHN
jgi:hypothetical protein